MFIAFLVLIATLQNLRGAPTLTDVNINEVDCHRTISIMIIHLTIIKPKVGQYLSVQPEGINPQKINSIRSNSSRFVLNMPTNDTNYEKK